MKKQKWLLLVIGICFFAGISCLIAGLFMGASREDYQSAFQITDKDMVHFFQKKKSEELPIDREAFLSENYSEEDWDKTTFDGITKMEVELLAGQMNVFSYAGDSIILYTAKDSRRVEVEQSKEKLEIHTKSAKGIFFGSDVCQVVLLIPKNLNFSQVDLEIQAGKAQIEQLLAKKLEVEVDAGDLTIEEMDARKAEIYCNAGSAKVMFRGNKEDYFFKGEVGAGKLSYADEKYTELSSDEIYLGDKGADKKISAECNAGSVDIMFLDI